MHTCQVAVYLFVDTILYITLLPSNTSCVCSQASHSEVLERCSCYVPQLMKSVVLTRSAEPLQGGDAAAQADMVFHQESDMQELQDHLKLVRESDPRVVAKVMTMMEMLQ